MRSATSEGFLRDSDDWRVIVAFQRHGNDKDVPSPIRCIALLNRKRGGDGCLPEQLTNKKGRKKRQPCQKICIVRLLDPLQHESVLRRNTAWMASSGIRMFLSQFILIAMTNQMSGNTMCTCHRNLLNCSQIVKKKQKKTHTRQTAFCEG